MKILWLLKVGLAVTAVSYILLLSSPRFGAFVRQEIRTGMSMGSTTRLRDRNVMLVPHLQTLSSPLRELVQKSEDPAVPLVQRISAGQKLAELGDPRIQIFEPQMIEIPGQKVKIGLPAEQLQSTFERLRDAGVELSWIRKEVPQHEVTIAPFRAAKFKVTNSEYLDFIKNTGERELPSSWEGGCYPKDRANHPVYTVTIEAVERYFFWLNQKTHRRFRLMTEDEWEYAASGGKEIEYPWGDEFDPNNANTKEAGLDQSSPVGVFVTGNSPFGLADMAGNVEEFVSNDYYPYPGGADVQDLFGDNEKTYRMTRGGAFNKRRDFARCKRRHGWYPEHAIGFRLAESVDDEATASSL